VLELRKRIEEAFRRVVKLFLYVVISRCDTQRYMVVRGRVMAWLVRHRLYEGNYLSALPTFVQRGDTVVDVGAHFGAYSVRLAELVGRSGKVIAFEPLQGCVECLESLRPSYPQIEVLQVALGAGSKAAKTFHIPFLFGFVPEPALASLVEPQQRHQSITVPCGTLDDLLNGADRISFIKLDVEGAEFEVLRGAEALLQSSRPAILMEVNRPHAVWPNIQEFCDTYRYLPFKLTGAGTVQIMTPQEIVETNIFLLPSST